MKQTLRKRSAFTMIELIFTIVILGIVSSIGAEIISQVYESYILQRAQYKSSMKTELALNQIANRLRYAILGTVGFRPDLVTAGGFKNITEPNTGNDKVLQWVAYDGDSFEAMTSLSRRPGWSGFCDINLIASTSTVLSTPGSNMALTRAIISNMGGNINTSRIYFPDNSSYQIASGVGESITLAAAIPNGSKIFERYKLAWTSYALEVDANKNLILHYNFAPIYGQPIAGSSSILLYDVANFRFSGSEGSLRIKICKEEQIGLNATDKIHACKERVIF